MIPSTACVGQPRARAAPKLRRLKIVVPPTATFPMQNAIYPILSCVLSVHIWPGLPRSEAHSASFET